MFSSGGYPAGSPAGPGCKPGNDLRRCALPRPQRASTASGGHPSGIWRSRSVPADGPSISRSLSRCWAPYGRDNACPRRKRT